MELSKHYDPAITEEKWYKHWMNKGYFKSEPDETKPPFTLVIPPPNVTGVLHMGHTLNETVQDILARKARMSGFNVCWVPGSDHASIATEAKVVTMLKEKGIEKGSLTREEFLRYAYEWKEKYGGIIYGQIKKLGCSVDWDRVTFTMDDHYYKAVIKIFVELYQKGLIYRGARMINWDPAAKTALSDEEVEYREVQGKLYYVKYLIAESGLPSNPAGDKIAQSNQLLSDHYIVIATQRPETIMGDTAVCVNPNDERYINLKGKKVIVPLVNRLVPVIFDDYVDSTFGTGVLKVTPAHDINDYNLGIKHKLAVIDTLNDDGTLSESATVFVGVDRFEARKRVVEQLRDEGLLAKEEEYQTRIGFSQRSNAIVEPRISTQWFLKMKELAGPALDAISGGDISIYPQERFYNTYKYWLENVKDWCISRQLWWGQQIPAWYDDHGNVYVGETIEEVQNHLSNPGERLTQDEDVLDTWFSSWIWPIEVFNGITDPGNKQFNYYYPTAVLVTGHDIIFFWVARMIMAGYHFKHVKPFSDVYFTGMVRDKQGRKMSKSLGNSPDLLELIDKYGADAVRFGIMILSPAGNDLLFDESSLEQGRHFNNKIWNALKLVSIWRENLVTSADMNSENFAVEWFENRLNEAKSQVESMYRDFKLSEALKTIYSLVWDDFCSWYLEWIKPNFQQGLEKYIYDKTLYFFEELLQLLHPFMPFISEEIYHLLKERQDDLCSKLITQNPKIDPVAIAEGELLKKTITEIRNQKTKLGLKSFSVLLTTKRQIFLDEIFKKSIKASKVSYTELPTEGLKSIIVGEEKFYIESDDNIEPFTQKEDLMKDIEHLKGFLATVMKKLNNEKFVQNAKPDVIALEQKKKADAEAKIKALEESLTNLQ
jgi:valyl-tRNA synthetase